MTDHPEPSPTQTADHPLVINAGVSGNTTREMLARLETDVFAHRPDLVVLLAGTNDCCNSGKLAEPAATAATYAALVDAILPRARLILATPPAYHAPFLAARHAAAAYGALPAAERMRQARAALAALAARHRLPLVDLHAITAGAGLIGEDPRSWTINPANGGRPDGVHPSADGYRAIAAAIAVAVMALSPRVRRIVCLGDSITFGETLPGAGTATGETYPAWLSRILAAG